MKTAPTWKRAAPAPSGPKKKQTVAAKQKHVRELAKAGRWAEVRGGWQRGGETHKTKRECVTAD